VAIVKAFDACPSHAKDQRHRHVLQMHERSARVVCVMEPDMADARGLEHSRPPRCQGVRTECTPSFVYNHVAARCVVFAERQTVGGMDGPGGTQCGGQVFRDR
jgi:hypothetical protein